MTSNMMSELEYEQKISGMSQEALIPFIAREVYKNNIATAKIKKALDGNGETGIIYKLDATIKKQSDNRKLIIAMWTFNLLTLSTLIGMFVTGLGGN